MCLGSYNRDKGESRESETGTAKQRANKGPRDEAKGKWTRFWGTNGEGQRRGALKSAVRRAVSMGREEGREEGRQESMGEGRKKGRREGRARRRAGNWLSS